MNAITRTLLAVAALVTVACAPDEGTSAEPEESPTEATSLVGTHWWVEDIAGRGVVDRARTTIGFLEDGRAGGSTGCNRWNGVVTLAGERIAFGPAAVTRRMCPEALMGQEQGFLEALDRVQGLRISPDTGLLHLVDADGETVLRASRLGEGEEA